MQCLGEDACPIGIRQAGGRSHEQRGETPTGAAPADGPDHHEYGREADDRHPQRCCGVEVRPRRHGHTDGDQFPCRGAGPGDEPVEQQHQQQHGNVVGELRPGREVDDEKQKRELEHHGGQEGMRALSACEQQDEPGDRSDCHRARQGDTREARQAIGDPEQHVETPGVQRPRVAVRRPGERVRGGDGAVVDGENAGSNLPEGVGLGERSGSQQHPWHEGRPRCHPGMPPDRVGRPGVAHRHALHHGGRYVSAHRNSRAGHTLSQDRTWSGRQAPDSMRSRSFSKESVHPSRWRSTRAWVANVPCQSVSLVPSSTASSESLTTVSRSSGSGSSQRNV